MSDRRPDPDLWAQFDAQRRDDARNAPSFAQMMWRAHADVAAESHAPAKPHTTRIRHRREWLGGLAAAAVIAALIVIPRTRDGDDAFEQAVRAFRDDPALGAWQSPTSTLLRLPGDGLLTTIPAIGTEQ